jgi:glycosidase
MKTISRVLALIVAFSLLAGCVSPKPAPTQTSQPSTAATTAPTTQSTQPAATQPTTVETELPWWNDAVFYEVFVRSFKDSDGDGKGDINGLIEKLDYLNDGDPATTTDLGITGLWLMPIMESPSYHGYDVVDYYTIDEEYGTNEDFKRLMDEAHQRGIHVVVDLVLNHTGLDHPWFEASDAGDPNYRDWYIWSETDPKYRGPWGEQVWYPAKDGFYYAVFWSGMPDLNLQNPEVTAEIYKIADFWLKDMGVDGFRMDAIKHFVERGAVQENVPETHVWLQAFHQHYKSVNPQAFVVGEAWTDTSQVLDYTGDEVDIAFEFDLAGAFVRSAQGPIASTANSQMQLVIDTYPQGQYGVFLTNHDQDRVMSVLKDVQKAKLAAVMLLTAPGVPFIYYGEEIGMTGVKPDEDIRRPMQWCGDNSKVCFTTGSPWRMPSTDYKDATTVLVQTGDPESLLSLYRTLIQLRNAHPALRTGDALVLDGGTQRLYALLRYNGQEAFLILVNVHTKALTTSLYDLKLPSGPFTGPVTATTVVGALANPAAPQINAAGGFDSYQPFVEIPAGSYAIIQLQP